jgi:hypothetical protein
LSWHGRMMGGLAGGELHQLTPSTHADSMSIYPIRKLVGRQLLYSMPSIRLACPILNKCSHSYMVAIFVEIPSNTAQDAIFSLFQILFPDVIVEHESLPITIWWFSLGTLLMVDLCNTFFPPVHASVLSYSSGIVDSQCLYQAPISWVTALRHV